MQDEQSQVKANLIAVRQRISSLVEEHHAFEVKKCFLLSCPSCLHFVSGQPRLVAVSKLKPVEYIQAAYDEGQRVFGENYVQELVEKAKKLPLDIQWHMIGHVTSSNINALLKVPNLHVLETVDSEGLARKLNERLARTERRLNVFVQVHTSGEESKYGVAPQDALALCRIVHSECPQLSLCGLMTIGKLNGPPEEDFRVLIDVRNRVSQELQIPLQELELSMGMSGDYDAAIRFGSTNIRLGSTIFGARDKH